MVEEAFRQIKASIDLQVAYDGAEALTLLPHAAHPDLILLDLNLPKMNGRDVLACIKEHNHLKTIPTIILTSYEVQDDVTKCHELHADSYLKKPLKREDFAKLVISLHNFWLTTHTPPVAGAPSI